METVLWQILPVVLSICAPILVVLATWLARKLGAKLDLASQSAINDLVINLTSQGVAYAEQIAKKRAAENEAVNGSTKLYMATEYVLEQLTKYNVPQITAQEIQKKIEAILGSQTLEAGAVLEIGGQDEEDDFNVDK